MPSDGVAGIFTPAPVCIQALLGVQRSPAQLLAPTPANTPQIGPILEVADVGVRVRLPDLEPQLRPRRPHHLLGEHGSQGHAAGASDGFVEIWLNLILSDEAVYHPTYYQQLQLEQWVIAVCGGRDSLADVMFVTKLNMANAVQSMSKQLEQVSSALDATKRHLTQRLENLDGKMDEQVEVSKGIRNEVNDVKDDLAQIGFDIESIQLMVAGLEGKIELLENKQYIFLNEPHKIVRVSLI